MKFIATLALAVAVQGIQADSEVEQGPPQGSPRGPPQGPPQDYSHPHQDRDFEGEKYFSNPKYVEPDYSIDRSGEVLPGADFNKQVYAFEEKKTIWDQNDYEERVKVEAELMVSLEALKASTNYLGSDMDQLNTILKEQYEAIGANQEDIYTNMKIMGESFLTTAKALASVQDKCHFAQADLKDYRSPIILYCQQFAFAPDMVSPCTTLLKHRETHLPFRYRFNGSYVHPNSPSDQRSEQRQEHHDHRPIPQGPYQGNDPNVEQKASSHGIELVKTGGHVRPQLHVDPELAAAAVSGTEAVIQINGRAIVVPMDQIDPNKLELACDMGGCALIPDDGNPHNDIIVPGMDDPLNHQHQPHGAHGHIVKQDTQHGVNLESQFPGGPGRPQQHHEPYAPEVKRNSHDIVMPIVGGNVNVGHHVDPELAAAAFNAESVVIVHNGEAFLAPIDAVDPDVVELACSEEGCVLIKDDGNHHNDIIVPGMHHDVHHGPQDQYGPHDQHDQHHHHH